MTTPTPQAHRAAEAIRPELDKWLAECHDDRSLHDRMVILIDRHTRLPELLAALEHDGEAAPGTIHLPSYHMGRRDTLDKIRALLADGGGE